MTELTPAQLEALHAALLKLQAELPLLISRSDDDVKPVELDQPIGRLSRMDAIQQQKMSAATRLASERRLKLVEQALRFFDSGEYGDCRSCEEPIGFARLQARPETPLCLACQGAAEGR